MFSSPIKFLIILLASLQLVAPLVHAHTGEEHSSQRVHLPEFEHFSLSNDSQVFQALTASLSVDASSIISIGSAIKHKKAFTGHKTPYSLPAENANFKSATRHCSIHNALQQQAQIPARHYHLLPVRAPPQIFKSLL